MKHSDPARLAVSHLRMEYEGRRYAGHGLLAWDPERGYELDARLELSRGDIPTQVSFGAGPFVVPMATLVMEVEGLGRGLVRTPHFQSRAHDLKAEPFWQNVTFDRARFVRGSRPSRGEACFAAYHYPRGSALLPEIVFTTRKLGKQGKELEGWNRAGLRAVVAGCEISGILDGTTLELGWAFDKGRPIAYRRRAEAIATALTAISAKPISLLRYEIVSSSRVEEEVRRKQQHSPIVADGLIGGIDVVKIDEFEALVACLEQPSTDALVVRRIVWGVMNAFQHRAESAIDLAVSTILEGALRTLQNRNDKPWRVKHGLRWFLEAYRLPNEWTRLNKLVDKSYGYLRGRNAHPFWRTPAPPNDADATLQHRNRLIRYLGLQVRVIAGLSVNPVLPQVIGDPPES